MDFFRKLLVLFIILITTYILFRLYKKRQKLLAGDLSEGFLGFGSSVSGEIKNMTSQSIPKTTIMNNADENANAPLKQYIIKGAYNSACSGEYFSTDAIQYVLSRGCRLLDFEVFYDQRHEDIYVSKTTDPSFNITPKNSISFMDAMTSVISNGFSSLVPNNTDPLFIQIRPKSLNANTFSMISATIISTFGNKLYGKFNELGVYTPTMIDPNHTLLSSLNKKVIIMVDVSPVKNMAEIASGCTGQNCNTIDIANMIVGQPSLPKSNYKTKIKIPHTPYDIDFSKKPPTTTIRGFEEVVPDADSRGNMNIYNIIYNYGIQLTPGLFYYNDEELYNYEVLFENQRSAFATLASAHKYIGTTSQFN